MQADLFDQDIPEDGQDAYRQALEARVAAEGVAHMAGKAIDKARGGK